MVGESTTPKRGPMTREIRSSIAMVKTGSAHAAGVFTAQEGPQHATWEADLLVEVRAVSVNPIDCRIRRGATVGPESSGGIRVLTPRSCGLPRGPRHVHGGRRPRLLRGPSRQIRANTNQQVVDANGSLPQAENVSPAEAAALPLTALTAWEGLFDNRDSPRIRLGRPALGGGAVGPAVIQLAHALTTCELPAFASRPGDAALVREFGAHVSVNHSSENWRKRSASSLAGVDYVFSTHSAGILPLLARVMNPFGQIVAIDSAPGGRLPSPETQGVDMALGERLCTRRMAPSTSPTSTGCWMPSPTWLRHAKNSSHHDTGVPRREHCESPGSPPPHRTWTYCGKDRPRPR